MRIDYQLLHGARFRWRATHVKDRRRHGPNVFMHQELKCDKRPYNFQYLLKTLRVFAQSIARTNSPIKGPTLNGLTKWENNLDSYWPKNSHWHWHQRPLTAQDYGIRSPSRDHAVSRNKYMSSPATMRSAGTNTCPALNGPCHQLEEWALRSK